MFAYPQQETDVIYLNNQSIIKGKIIEQAGETVKIETCCGSIFAYSTEEILKITTEATPKPDKMKQKGYLNYTSTGLLIGSSENNKAAPFSFLMEHNYRFNEYLSAGCVFGIELLDEATAPLGGNIKLMKNLSESSSLFLGSSAGYSISLEKPVMNNYEVLETNGGPFFNAELGLILPSGKNTGFFVAVGYRYSTLSYLRDDWWLEEVERKVYYNRLSVRIGITLF